MEETDCLIRCHGEHCSSSQCCSRENYLEDTCESTKDMHTVSRKRDKKEIIPIISAINLKKCIIYEEETSVPSVEDLKSENSTNSLTTRENTCPSNDEQIQNIKEMTTDANSYAISVHITERTSTSADNNQDRPIVS